MKFPMGMCGGVGWSRFRPFGIAAPANEYTIRLIRRVFFFFSFVTMGNTRNPNNANGMYFCYSSVQGHDTTAAAVNWALLLIGQHPTVQARLHDEIDQVFGKYWTWVLSNNNGKFYFAVGVIS